MPDGGFKGECSPVAMSEEMDPTEAEGPPKSFRVVRVRCNAVTSVGARPLRPATTELVVEHDLKSSHCEVS